MQQRLHYADIKGVFLMKQKVYSSPHHPLIVRALINRKHEKLLSGKSPKVIII
jgi:hypothetical protein